jgi:hypothetical protein
MARANKDLLRIATATPSVAGSEAAAATLPKSWAEEKTV